MQRGYFRPQAVAKLLDTHCRREANHAEYLWDLLMLELWHQTFIDNKDHTTPVPTGRLTTRHTDSVFSRIV